MMAAIKYKAGDKVRIRRDLKSGEYYGDYAVSTYMLPFIGAEVEICKARPKCYYIIEDAGFYAWTDEMLEEIPAPENTSVFSEGEEDILFLDTQDPPQPKKLSHREQLLRKINKYFSDEDDRNLAQFVAIFGCEACPLVDDDACRSRDVVCQESVFAWLKETNDG